MRKKILCFTILICFLFSSSCQKKLGEKTIEFVEPINKKEERSLLNSGFDSLFPPTKVSEYDLEWKEWESVPYTVETKTMDESIKNGKSDCTIKGAYPVIHGFNDLSLENQVNQWIKEAIIQRVKPIKEYYAKLAKKYLTNLKENPSSVSYIPHSSFVFSFKIMLLSDSYISVLYEFNEHFDGIHGYDRSLAINIDLKNKKLLTEADLFYPKSDYWETIRPLFKEELYRQLKEKYDREATSSDSYFEYGSIGGYLSYNLAPDGLVFTMSTNEADASYEYRMQVKIPYDKIASVTPFKTIPNSYGYLSSLPGWEIVENKISRHFDHNKGYTIKYPAIREESGKITNCRILNDGDVLLEIPIIDDFIATILIQCWDSESEILQQKPDEYRFKISGIGFDRVGSGGSDCYTTSFLDARYTITINLPWSYSFPYPDSDYEVLNKKLYNQVNMVLGTFRFN